MGVGKWVLKLAAIASRGQLVTESRFGHQLQRTSSVNSGIP